MNGFARAIIASAIALSMLGTLAAPARAATTASGEPYVVNILLPLTGTNAFLGKVEVESMKLIEKMTNEAGGIKGRPLKFSIQDDTSSPQVALQLANELVSKHVPVILGSSSAAICGALAPLVEKNGPVEYCYSPSVHPFAGSYVFSASVGSVDLGAVMVRYFRERGWKNIALLTSTDATGQDWDHVMDVTLALPENHDVKVVAHEHFSIGDVSVAAQIAKIKATNPQVMIAYTTGTPFGTVLHGAHDGGLEIPIAGANSNMSYEQLAGYANFLPPALLFAGMRAMVPAGTGPGPIKDAQTRYFKAFKSDNFKPQFANNLVWDGTQLVVDALRSIGPSATAEQIHAYIEGLHSWAGINGIYDFRSGDQRGIGQLAALMYQWNPSINEFTVVSKAAGHVK
jgi:branched-chain amino acid transport system substrate-binding protein